MSNYNYNRKNWKVDQVTEKVFDELASYMSPQNSHVLLEYSDIPNELLLTFNSGFKREKTFVISIKEFKN